MEKKQNLIIKERTEDPRILLGCECDLLARHLVWILKFCNSGLTNKTPCLNLKILQLWPYEWLLIRLTQRDPTELLPIVFLQLLEKKVDCMFCNYTMHLISNTSRWCFSCPNSLKLLVLMIWLFERWVLLESFQIPHGTIIQYNS